MKGSYTIGCMFQSKAGSQKAECSEDMSSSHDGEHDATDIDRHVNSEEEFWQKQEDMRRKYLEDYQKILPSMRRLQLHQSRESMAEFSARTEDALNILTMERPQAIPEGLTVAVLERAEKIIMRLILVQLAYLKNVNSQRFGDDLHHGDNNSDEKRNADGPKKNT